MMITPRTLILIDVAGAFLTSMITLTLFATNSIPTGMPSWPLILLGIAAALLGLFGAYRLATARNHLNTLSFLAFLNIDFSILSAVLWWSNLDQLTLLGRFYFPVEIFIIVILLLFELRQSLSKEL
jgi:hypothetical protein